MGWKHIGTDRRWGVGIWPCYFFLSFIGLLRIEYPRVLVVCLNTSGTGNGVWLGGKGWGPGLGTWTHRVARTKITLDIMYIPHKSKLERSMTDRSFWKPIGPPGHMNRESPTPRTEAKRQTYRQTRQISPMLVRQPKGARLGLGARMWPVCERMRSYQAVTKQVWAFSLWRL